MELRDNIQVGSWQDVIISSFVGGMKTDAEPETLEQNKSPYAANLFFRRGKVLIDTGYSSYLGTVRGVPRLTYQFFYRSGASEELLITNDTLYKSANNEWQYISDGTSTTTTAIEPTGETAIAVTDETGFSGSDYIGIILDDGSQHQTTVASTSAGVINIDDAIPTGRQVDNGAAVIKAVDLSGSLDKQISIVTVSFQDWVIFTNGVDAPKRYDGTDCIDVPNLPSSGNFVAAAVTIYKDYVLFLNCTEGGTSYPQRIRRSDTGDPTNWSTGNAGYTDLSDSEDFLIAGVILGPYLVIYRERGIVRVDYLGTDEAIFSFESMVSGIGTLSHDSIIDLGDSHAFLGNAGLYEYRGGYDVDPIGDDIYYEMFGVNATSDASKSQRNWAFYVEELDEIWFAITQLGDDSPKRVYRYNVADESYVIRDFAEELSGFGYSSVVNDITWNDLIGDWNNQGWAWNSRQLSSASPVTHLLSKDNNQVYSYDYLAPDDDGSDIDYQIQTKDFIVPGYEIRLDSLRMKYIGTGVNVSYSTDQGDTWTLLEALPNTNSFQVGSIHKQLVAERIRFKFHGSGGGFGLSWLNFKYRVENEVR